MIKKLTLLSLALGLPGAGSTAAPPTIERLAPTNSVFIAGINSTKQSIDRVKRTPLWSLWESDEFKALRTRCLEQVNGDLDEFFEELGVERDTLVPPSGAAGLAVFPVRDREIGTVEAGFLLVADYGPDAGKTATLIDALIAKAEQEGDLESEPKEILGRTVHTLDLSKAAARGADELNGFGPGDVLPFMPDPAQMIGGLDTLHYVRDRSVFMVSSDLASLTGALEVIDGEARNQISERESYQAVMHRLGEVDGYAVLFTQDLLRMAAASDPMGMVMMIRPIISSLIGDVEAVGVGIRIDAGPAMIRETFAVYMPTGKAGLTTLVDTESPRGDLPPFVGPQAISYGRINFEFDGLLTVFRSVGRANPMLQQLIEQMLLEQGQLLEELFAALGTKVHTVATVSRPITLSSLQSLFAIECPDPEKVENLLAAHAAEFGLEPRDFLGHRIYTAAIPFALAGPMMPAGDAADLSIGFGGGHVMIGSTALVEDALRATSRKGAPTLADDPAYRRALRLAPDDAVVAWGVANLVDYVEFFRDSEELREREMIRQLRQWNPEYAQQMEAELRAKEPAPWKEFDIALLRRYVGPLVWQLRSTDDGFVGTYDLLAAEAAE